MNGAINYLIKVIPFTHTSHPTCCSSTCCIALQDCQMPSTTARRPTSASSTTTKRRGGKIELEFYAPTHCTTRCKLRESNPIHPPSHRFVQAGIVEHMILRWSQKSLFAIDTAMHHLLLGNTYLRMRKRSSIPYPAYAKVTREELRLAQQVAHSTAGAFGVSKPIADTSPVSAETYDNQCAERWREWDRCIGRVLNRMGRRRWSFVCVGVV